MKITNKNLLILFVLFLSKISIAQFQYTEDRKTYMEEVVEVDSTSKEKLFDMAKAWMVGNLKSSDNQTFLNDETKSKIIGTGNVLLKMKQFGTLSTVTVSDRIVNFKMTISFKENKYKYYIDNIVYSQIAKGSQTGITPFTMSVDQMNEMIYERESKKRKKTSKRLTQQIEFRKEIEDGLMSLIQSLKSSMNGNNNDDW